MALPGARSQNNLDLAIKERVVLSRLSATNKDHSPLTCPSLSLLHGTISFEQDIEQFA
jgi:hypothetical protein